MSFDLGVWCSDIALSQEGASAFYQNVGRRWINLQHSDDFDAFFRDLLAKYPNIGGPGDELAHAQDLSWWLMQNADSSEDETVKPTPPPGGWKFNQAEMERSPWAATLDVHGCSVQLPMISSKAEKAIGDIETLAMKYGLVLYDPQGNKVYLPAKLAHLTPGGPRPLLIMNIAGKRPKFDVHISLRGKEIAHEVMPSRVSAHARARALALENKLAAYEVNDPQTIAQEDAVEIPADDPSLPDVVKVLIDDAKQHGSKVTVGRYASGLIEIKVTDKDGLTTTSTIAIPKMH